MDFIVGLVSVDNNSGSIADPAKFGADPQYEDLYEGPYGPSPAVLRVAEDPLTLFSFYATAAMAQDSEGD